MLELPESHVLARQIGETIVGKTIQEAAAAVHPRLEVLLPHGTGEHRRAVAADRSGPFAVGGWRRPCHPDRAHRLHPQFGRLGAQDRSVLGPRQFVVGVGLLQQPIGPAFLGPDLSDALDLLARALGILGDLRRLARPFPGHVGQPGDRIGLERELIAFLGNQSDSSRLRDTA